VHATDAPQRGIVEKLCTPIDSRVTPAARKARKRSRSKVPGLASSVTRSPAPAAAARADVGQQAVDAFRAETGWACRRR
jgi:hypothetical protein